MRQHIWRLGWLQNFIPVSFWKCCINFLELLLVYGCWSTFKLFYVIDILVGFNYVSMLITCLSNELGWIFLVISIQEIILCENYYSNIYINLVLMSHMLSFTGISTKLVIAISLWLVIKTFWYGGTILTVFSIQVYLAYVL